jgi:hypothetical protein
MCCTEKVSEQVGNMRNFGTSHVVLVMLHRASVCLSSDSVQHKAFESYLTLASYLSESLQQFEPSCTPTPSFTPTFRQNKSKPYLICAFIRACC